MINPENKVFYPLDSLTSSTVEQQRLQALADLGLLEAESVPVFEEATQTAAHLLDMPICVLSVLDQDREWLKSAVGLSRLGLMNELAASRQLPRTESLCTQIVEGLQTLCINDTLNDPAFANSLLVQRYRIRAYLGVPLLDSARHCLGTLAVMDLVPRTFTPKELESLELIARWSMSEFERNYLLKVQHPPTYQKPTPVVSRGNTFHPAPATVVPHPSSTDNPIKVELLAQLTQELRTPLTSVMGMASVLNREIYGPLTSKQKEYLDIIYQSGQYLLSLVNEIVELGALDASSHKLTLMAVDIEMLCQQVIKTLEQATSRREQHLRLSIEPGPRIWLLDKNKVRQMLYHLIFSVSQSCGAESIIRIHVSRKLMRLNLAIWVSHPWLGDSLPHADLYAYQQPMPALPNRENLEDDDSYTWNDPEPNPLKAYAADTQTLTKLSDGLESPETKFQEVAPMESRGLPVPLLSHNSRESLELLLSRQLAEIHGGQISIQGSAESGYRYVISLPQFSETSASS
ncbi:MAG: GAF domain-containing sensor histidine kinase [Leptolyngbyaceae bacterium]|nr:GAF domain-containing sensor histidine kinase [Leptolyngbyaceae bacterium]